MSTQSKSNARRDTKLSRDLVAAETPGTYALHLWWELSHAQYLTVPRSVMQSMPDEWQAKMAALLEELDDLMDWRPSEGRYWVNLRDYSGRFVRDQFAEYERGRRRIQQGKSLK